MEGGGTKLTLHHGDERGDVGMGRANRGDSPAAAAQQPMRRRERER